MTVNITVVTWNITVTTSDGRDLTAQLAASPAIDADRVRGQAIGSLSGLSRDETITALAQIIDTGHEWGLYDPDYLYALAANGVKSYLPFSFTAPDGWTVRVGIATP